MTHRTYSRRLALVLLAGLALPTVTHAQPISAARQPVADNSGAVYSATNGVTRNELLAYRRAADGSLSFVGTFPTGGRGSGGAVDPLQSQNSVLLSEDHRFLFAVNTASGDISSFTVMSNGRLRLLDKTPSGGGFPVSLAIRGDLLYVLNSGGAGSVSGFHVNRNGRLLPIPGSTHLLSAPSAGGASIDFSPDGTVLAATERLTNRVDTFPIDAAGKAGAPILNPSSGRTPFSLTFTSKGVLVVAEANGNPQGGAALSSYAVRADKSLSVITASAPTAFAAACWVVATANGNYAYTANAGSDELSEAAIGNDGQLNVFASIGTGTGTVPLDLALAGSDHFLYTLTAGAGTITGFRVEANGALTALSTIPAQPAASGQNGLAAY